MHQECPSRFLLSVLGRKELLEVLSDVTGPMNMMKKKLDAPGVSKSLSLVCAGWEETD